MWLNPLLRYDGFEPRARVQRMLQLKESPAPDAADALALALAYAQETSRYSLAGPKKV